MEGVSAVVVGRPPDLPRGQRGPPPWRLPRHQPRPHLPVEGLEGVGRILPCYGRLHRDEGVLSLAGAPTRLPFPEVGEGAD